MSERWWAPGGSTDLLTPGSDAKADLGLFLLAAHRAGAEALVAVSKGAIPSETGIITALAETRAKIAPQLVDAIATHLEPTYAGVLVRDVLDAGDRGAVDVYRAMVAKGVAPPVAAERAAEAYGMPMRQMGRFPSLATDPKTNPRVVVDAADRALMSYVSKMADAEAPAVAEVSKVEHPREGTTLVRDTDFDRLHPRDALGQFTETPDAPTKPGLSTIDRIRMRLGLLSPEPTRVAEVTAAPAEPERVQRAKRTKRVQRSKPKLVATGATAHATAHATARASMAQAQAITTAVNAGTVEARAPKGSKPPMVVPDLLKELPPGNGPYYDIGQSIVIGVPMAASNALRSTAGDQAMTQEQRGRRLFRMGYLTKEAHYVEQFGKDQKGAHDSKAGDTVQQHADTWLEPKVLEVGHEQLAGSQDEAQNHLQRLKNAMATKRKMVDGMMQTVPDEDEQPYVKSFVAYRPYSPMGDVEPNDFVVVHYQESDVGERAMPKVDEYVVEYDARGKEEGSGKHIDIELDPNQVYELIAPPHRTTARGARVEPERFYDTVNHVEVNRWFLRPVDEEDVDDIIAGFKKALDVMEARTFEQLHPRDAEGQFTEVADRPTLISPAARPMKTQRTQRLKRTKRVQRGQRTQTEAAPQAQRQAVHTMVHAGTKRSAMAAAMAAPQARSKALRDVPVLTDAKHYRVFTEDEFQGVFEGISRNAFSAMHIDNVPVRLEGDNKKTFYHQREVKVGAIPEAMALNLGVEVARQEIHRDVIDEIPYHARGGVPDYEHVAERVHHLLDSRPEYDLIEIEKDEMDHQITVYGSMVSGGFQNVVEFDPNIDWSGPIEIHFMGEFRARDALSKKESVITSLIGELEGMNAYEDDPAKTSVANPMVHRYRVTSPPVRRYRADNR